MDDSKLKLAVTDHPGGIYDISWDYSDDPEAIRFNADKHYAQFMLDDTSAKPEIVEFKKRLAECPGSRMIEFLGRTTPVFKTVEEAQWCIDNIMWPYIVNLKMQGKWR